MLACAVLLGSLARAAAPGPGVRVPATYAFGLLLVALWAVVSLRGGQDPVSPLGATPRGLILGAVTGIALLVPGLLLRATGHPTNLQLLGLGYFVPLVPVLTWVAAAEELVLRGALQPLLRRAVGPGPAIMGAALVFAGMHLATYGWAAMPLDLGVGLLLGWLREETGGIAAPVTAHVLADLGGWFLA